MAQSRGSKQERGEENDQDFRGLMVGAPRFELGTPSPPGSGSMLYFHVYFANSVGFRLLTVNGLRPLLQTVCPSFELEDRRVRERLGTRQIDLEDVRDVLEAVAGDGRDLGHRAAGLRQHCDRRTP
jgi:hypothetical protein